MRAHSLAHRSNTSHSSFIPGWIVDRSKQFTHVLSYVRIHAHALPKVTAQLSTDPTTKGKQPQLAIRKLDAEIVFQSNMVETRTTS